MTNTNTTNANLIEAAPELLLALQELILRCQEGGVGTTRAEEAVADATGIYNYNNKFKYMIHRSLVIIEDKAFGQDTMYRIYDTDVVSAAATLHLKGSSIEFDECSFAGAMQRIDKWEGIFVDDID